MSQHAVFCLSVMTLCLFIIFTTRMRGVGTAATNMCLVASGCVEAYYEIGIHCWDIAAGAVIVTEAGGVLMDVEGRVTFCTLSSYVLVLPG